MMEKASSKCHEVQLTASAGGVTGASFRQGVAAA